MSRRPIAPPIPPGGPGAAAEPAGGARPLTERQRRVLEAAAEVFAERGFDGATTAEIAQRAGVAEGTIFKRFRSKRDLLMAVMGPYLREVGAVGLRPIMEAALGDPEARLEPFLAAVVADRLRFLRSNPAVLRILFQELPFHPELLSVTAGMGSTLALVVERFQRSGDVDPGLPAASVARIVFAQVAAHLLASLFILPETGRPADAEVELAVRVLARGLAPRGPAQRLPVSPPSGRGAAG